MGRSCDECSSADNNARRKFDREVYSWTGGKEIYSERASSLGSIVMSSPQEDNGRGEDLLRAAYKDRGTKELGCFAAEKIIALRNPVLDPEKADSSKGVMLMTTPRRSLNMVGSEDTWVIMVLT